MVLLDNAQVSLTEIVKLMVHSWKWHLHLHRRLLHVVWTIPEWNEESERRPDDEKNRTHGSTVIVRKWRQTSVSLTDLCAFYVLFTICNLGGLGQGRTILFTYQDVVFLCYRIWLWCYGCGAVLHSKNYNEVWFYDAVMTSEFCVITFLIVMLKFENELK